MSGAAVGWSLAGWLFGGSDEGHDSPRLDRVRDTRDAVTAPELRSVENPSSDALQDADIIARLRTSDPEAIRALMHAHADLLTDVTYAIVRNEALAEEIVQEVFIWVWDARERLSIRGSVRAYLVHAARNRALNSIRRERSHHRTEDAVRWTHPVGGPTTTNAGEHGVLAAELQAAITAAIETLTPRVREAFLLHADHGLRAPEIATILGVVPATVHSWISRATKQLAIQLKPWL